MPAVFIDKTMTTKRLMEFYKNRGFFISYRQLREWQKKGIIHPQKISARKTLFRPAEAKWVGVVFLLRMAGKKLDFIKQARIALAKKESVEKGEPKRTEELANLRFLLQQQDKTTRILHKTLYPGSPIKIDVTSETDNEIVLTEMKAPKVSKAEAVEQMTSYRNYIESELKNKIVKCEVKRVREKRGLSQAVLAKVLEFSQARLSQIENGLIEPVDDEKQKMAEKLKERVGVLFPK